MKKIISFISGMALLVSMLSFSVSAATTSGPKLAAITFDDGPSGYTVKLLDGLKERHAKATFFMVGTNIRSHAETIKRMKAEGHQLGTHTMAHNNLSKLSADAIREKVNGVNDILTEICGEGDYWLRPPYGAFNATVKATVQTPMIYWSLDSLDWKSRNTEIVYQDILRQVHDGDIILLHDLYETSVDAALKAITTLQKEGYTFVTVEQLMKRRGIKPEKGVVYFDCPNKGINLPAVIPPTIATRATILGTKVIISKGSKEDVVHFTQDGNAPTKESSEYLSAFYVTEDQSVKAIAVGESEISEIADASISANANLSDEALAKQANRYKADFFAKSGKFVIGMKS